MRICTNVDIKWLLLHISEFQLIAVRWHLISSDGIDHRGDFDASFWDKEVRYASRHNEKTVNKIQTFNLLDNSTTNIITKCAKMICSSMLFVIITTSKFVQQ